MLIYDEAIRILTGQPRTASPKINGGWANRVISDFYALNNRQQGSTQAQSSAQTTNLNNTQGSSYEYFNNDFFNTPSNTATFDERVFQLATNIANALHNASLKYNNGVRLLGINASDIPELMSSINDALDLYNQNKDAK
jgi:hypothetical protein